MRIYDRRCCWFTAAARERETVFAMGFPFRESWKMPASERRVSFARVAREWDVSFLPADLFDGFILEMRGQRLQVWVLANSEFIVNF